MENQSTQDTVSGFANNVVMPIIIAIIPACIVSYHRCTAFWARWDNTQSPSLGDQIPCQATQPACRCRQLLSSWQLVRVTYPGPTADILNPGSQDSHDKLRRLHLVAGCWGFTQGSLVIIYSRCCFAGNNLKHTTFGCCTYYQC